MVSLAVVGPSMSGKTTLCMQLAGLDATTVHETCAANYLCVDVDGTEWHIWDTPSVNKVTEMSNGWAGEGVVEEASIVVVCHDGRRDSSPMPLVHACGIDKSILALTRGPSAAADVSYTLDYLRTTRSDGSLVPRAVTVAELLIYIRCLQRTGAYASASSTAYSSVL